MNVFVVTILVAILVVRSVNGAELSCSNFTNTKCAECVKIDDCYWCMHSQECSKWKWGDYPNCKGNEYFIGQCELNGVGIIIVFSFGVFLILVVVTACCICCCCLYIRRRRRREYVVLNTYERNGRRDMQERQRQFQARRDEIRHKYGLDTDDSTV